eukprot:gnl/Trimastix_PCT/3652.p1 GENE.gnl/Trimastix_PCT/3652~~gnl/Trimastix_PCT/3652.p1  ORF type:complete len:177 (+),score=0.43 gnl/Trimastix_PCT/3652:28-531(+)
MECKQTPTVSRKLFIQQLNRAQYLPDLKCFALPYLHFQKVWIQGYIVAIQDHLVFVDDGTGVAVVRTKTIDKRHIMKRSVGDYVMFLGKVKESTSMRQILAQKCARFNDQPNRIPLWWLEVIESHRRFLDAAAAPTSCAGDLDDAMEGEVDFSDDEQAMLEMMAGNT